MAGTAKKKGGAQAACLLALGAAASSACRTERPAAAQAASPFTRTAEIYLTTEVSGFIEPCGCTSKPLGGLPRLASVIRRSTAPRALIDAGNLLLPPEGYGPEAADQHRLKAHILARAFRQLGAVALNLGPADLHAGAVLLADLQREGAFPLVSANVRPVSEHGPTVAQSFLREVGGIRIGITGVATPERFTDRGAVTALEYAPAVRAEVSTLRKRGAELIVVLAHVGESGARDLAAAVPQIDLIVRAPGTPIGHPPAAPIQIGPVTIVEAGSQGQHLGRLTLRFGEQAPERPIPFDDGGMHKERERALIERKVRAYRRELEGWRQDPNKAEAVAAREAQIRRLEASLAAPVKRGPPLGQPHLAFELIPLGEDIPSDHQMQELLQSYYARLKVLNASKGDVAPCEAGGAEPLTYVGTARCVPCHEPAFKSWQQTKHASAWATLETQNKHFDLTCIGCHTIGYQQAGGFCRLSDLGELKDVGCESCHGPGSKHAVTADRAHIGRGSGETTCAARCHVPEHSDTFDYPSYVLRITGEGHRLRSLQ
jgi:hypothetical protein